MASSVIHMCVGKEIGDKLGITNNNMLLLGSIAPDISKHVGESKTRSHFFDNNDMVDINKFLDKYRDSLDHPFMLGYYIHLYTDFLWDKYFVSDIVNGDVIKLLDGTSVEKSPELYKKLIYSDYTNLNVQLLDVYNLDLSLFYENTVLPDLFMDEIPIEQLQKLIDYTGVIIANTKENKAYTFHIDNIKPFIKICTDLIYNSIIELNLKSLQ